ncbi:MAG: branched-chain amino acid ABC transporter substrate-binding protein, partial [Betaproteobacteria bacterium]|nr:branched-chain amino acid ABC transporter substrate-binding protein [Betaproteobacteria bacterium]
MKRKHTVIALSVGLALAGVYGSAFAAGEVTVTIGSAAPISGPQASFGQDNTNGVRMAINDLNKENIVIGGKKVI